MTDIKLSDTYNSEFNKDYKETTGGTNHCVVMTLHNCTGWSLHECHSYLERYGRRLRRGMTTKEVTQSLSGLRDYGFKVVEGEYTTRDRITINKFVTKHPEGVYFCLVSSHALCIKDGVLYDHSEKKRRQIKKAFKIVKI